MLYIFAAATTAVLVFMWQYLTEALRHVQELEERMGKVKGIIALQQRDIGILRDVSERLVEECERLAQELKKEHRQ